MINKKFGEWKTREYCNDYLFVECPNCGFMVENYKAVKIGTSSTDIVGNKYNFCPICGIEMKEKENEQPEADVEEVCRCKDCKFWNREHISCEGFARCNTGEGGIRLRRANDFCSVTQRDEKQNEKEFKE